MAPDSVTEKLYAPEWAPALRLLPDVVITPHWDALDEREPGMQEFAKAQVPEDCSLIAIDEKTALVGDGTRWEVYGGGNVRFGRRGRWARRGVSERIRSTTADRELPTEAVVATEA